MEISNRKKKKSRVDMIEESITYKILNFYKLKNTKSKIACHGKPKSKEISFMKLTYGVNYILTLLHDKEKPQDIGDLCGKNEMQWQLITLQGANVAYFKNSNTQKAIIEGLMKIYDILLNEEITLFVHCAAGLHRTGTILYCILRMFDESPETALKAIEIIRIDTRNKVGDDRINMAETVLVPVLLKKLSNRDGSNKDKTIISNENMKNEQSQLINSIISNFENFEKKEKTTKKDEI